MTIDIAIIFIYMLVINIIGLKSSKVRSVDDYFLGNRSIPWVIACFSIVATETSTLTFISIPGLAYIKGLGFLQIAMGYILGRILVAFILLPGYFKGNFETVYQFLQNKFGISSRRIIAVIFHITRLLADSVRLFATAIPLTLLTGLDYRLSVLIIGFATFIYTFYGGIKSVMIVDSIQLMLYLTSAIVGIYVITEFIPAAEVFKSLPAESIKIISTEFNSGIKGILGSYNIFSGLIGGAFLSFASHGTDHLMVQRILSCKNLKSAKKAMIISGVLVFLQFALFMILGLFIKVLLKDMSFSKPDEIMPFFIINHLPTGIKGLMLAGIFAAAMSTLSSSINSLSASTALDILRINDKDYSEKKKVSVSRIISFIWTIIIIAISTLLSNNTNPLVELGLGIASITYGGMLAIFIQGILFEKFNDRAAIIGVILSIAAVIIIARVFTIFWPWFVPIGFFVSFTVGVVLNFFMKK